MPLDAAAELQPMLAHARATPFSREGWVFEVKYDGFRLLALKEGSRVSLRYRSGGDATATFPGIAAAVAALPHARVVLDGEVVILDGNGMPSFDALQRQALGGWGSKRPRAPVAAATGFFFDLLVLDDLDVRPLPLVERKRILCELIPERGALRYVDHVEGTGEELFEAAARMGLEGVMAKRADSPYAAGRSPAWLKVKAELTGDFVAVGLAPPSRDTFSRPALHLAAMGARGLVYAGRVACGYREIAALRAAAASLARETPCCLAAPPRAEVWFDPAIVCEVRFLTWTDGGVLRQPVFLRLRPDKRWEDCGRHPGARLRTAG